MNNLPSESFEDTFLPNQLVQKSTLMDIFNYGPQDVYLPTQLVQKGTLMDIFNYGPQDVYLPTHNTPSFFKVVCK